MVQPVGIMIEDFVMLLGKAVGLRETVWTKSLGFFWAMLWFSGTLQFVVAYQPSS